MKSHESTQILKLSEIWERVSRELIQRKYDVGDARELKACDLGAIIFYATNGRTCRVTLRDPISLNETEPYGELIWRFEETLSEDIIDLNDNKDWTFEQCAEKVKQIGL